MFWLAFITGIVGSLHCVGMCGPIMLVLPTHENRVTDFLNKFIYQLGRIAAYSLMGVFIGFIGGEIVFAGLQQYLSVAIGLMLLLMAMGYAFPTTFEIPFFSIYKQKISNYFSARISSGNFVLLGFLNGLLPCGLVYMALVTALTADSYYNGAVYMSMFGLGTLPVMLIMAISRQYVKPSLRGIFGRIYPAFAITIAMLMIVRGLNLGIPYLSPKMVVQQEKATLECCRKK